MKILRTLRLGDENTIMNKNKFHNQFQGFLKMPNLFSGSQIFDIPSFETPILKPLDDSILDLQQLKKHKYLGKRAEYFMLAYLNQFNHYQPVYHSLQIQTDKSTTLGELDFLFFDETRKEWIHLELVCKFYVFTDESETDNLEDWIGPNLKDRLGFKIQKLKTHQLQICKQDEAQQLLKTLNIDAIKVKSQICYKAKLFLPENLLGFKPSLVNPNCIKGKYYHFEKFKAFKYSSDLFYIPEKVDWLCLPANNQKWYAFDKAEHILKSKLKEKRSQMLWRKTRDDEFFEEFVTWW